MNVVLIKSYTDKPWRSPETFKLIEKSLKEQWKVSSVHPRSLPELRTFLKQQHQRYGDALFVFNIAEYVDEAHKKGFIPKLLDLMKVAHLGSTAKAVTLGLDKARTKAVLDKHSVSTAPYFVADQQTESLQEHAGEIGYPLIVKPLKEGGHIGIEESSIVHNLSELKRAVHHVLTTYDQPAIVEMYITGTEMREFSVGIIDGKPLLATPIEIDYAAMGVETRILSYTTAQNDLERIKLVEEDKVRKALIRISKAAFAAVGAYDYSRVDLRMNHTGCYVLEINIMPGLGPHSFLPNAARQIHDLSYAQLIHTLAHNAMARQGCAI